VASRKNYELAIGIGGKINPSFNSSIKGASNQLGSLGKAVKMASGVAAAAFAAVKIKDFVADSVDTFKTYEQSIATTAATAGVAKGSEDYIKLQEAARAAGKATSKTAAESADALGYMALAGWSVNDSVSGLTPILHLSEATQADLATTSDMVTDSMSALGVTVKDLPRYLDITAQANNKSNQTALQLMEAYTGVGGTLKRLGTPLEESGALLGVLANRGSKGSEAGTDLSSILINLTKDSGESAVAMQKLGVNAYDSQGKFKGVTNVLKEVNEKTKGLTAEQRDTYLTMIGGKTQISTLNSLMDGLNTTNADGVSELESLQTALKNSDGALEQMAGTVNDTMRGAMDRLSSATDDFKIELIENLEPYIVPAMNRIAEGIPKITEKMESGLSGMKEKFSGVKEIAVGFMTLMDMNTDFTGISMDDSGAKEMLSDMTGWDTTQIDNITSALVEAKDTAISVASAATSAVSGILTTVKGVGDFVVDNMGTILPLAVGIGKAYMGIKFTGMVMGAGRAALAFMYLTKKKLIDKAETLYLQSLYAKDFFTKTVMGAKRTTIAYMSLIRTKLVDKAETLKLQALYAKDFFTNMVMGAKRTTLAYMSLIRAKLTDKLNTLYLQAIYAKDAIVKGISTAATWAQTAATGAWNIAAGVGATVTTALGAAFTFMTGPIGLAVLAVAGAIAIGVALYNNWDTVKEKASELWTGIQEIFGGIGGAISGAFRTGANAGISALNCLIRAANGIHFTVPDWIPGLGGKSYGLTIPEIPALAKGGIVTGPTLAAIGEGGENEVVFPLSKLESFLSNKLNDPASYQNESGEVFHIQYAPQITIQGNANKKDVEEALHISKEEFAQMMNEWTRRNKRLKLC